MGADASRLSARVAAVTIVNACLRDGAGGSPTAVSGTRTCATPRAAECLG
jgi:hypothetical protein